jgi:hypothetical protein
MNPVEGGHHCDRGETEEDADGWNQPRWRTPTGGSHGREVMVKFPVIPSRLAKIVPRLRCFLLCGAPIMV